MTQRIATIRPVYRQQLIAWIIVCPYCGAERTTKTRRQPSTCGSPKCRVAHSRAGSKSAAGKLSRIGGGKI